MGLVRGARLRPLEIPPTWWSRDRINWTFQAHRSANYPPYVQEALDLLRGGRIRSYRAALWQPPAPSTTSDLWHCYRDAFRGPTGSERHCELKWAVWWLLHRWGDPGPVYERHWVDVTAPSLRVEAECGYTPIDRLLQAVRSGGDCKGFLVAPYDCDYAVLFTASGGVPLPQPVASLADFIPGAGRSKDRQG